MDAYIYCSGDTSVGIDDAHFTVSLGINEMPKDYSGQRGDFRHALAKAYTILTGYSCRVRFSDE